MIKQISSKFHGSRCIIATAIIQIKFDNKVTYRKKHKTNSKYTKKKLNFQWKQMEISLLILVCSFLAVYTSHKVNDNAYQER